MKVCVAMNIWAVGGAERFYYRLAKKLPQYKWSFETDVSPDTDLVIYSNDHRFYGQAAKLNKPAIFRITGPRSHTIPQPDGLKYVVCSSRKSFEISTHKKKVLIYNGIDFESFKEIEPIECDLLYGCARVGVGQAPEVAIKYALKYNRHLTITGAKQHLAENTYDILRKKYPQINWTGLLDEATMLRYIKGCKSGVMPTSVHGVSNFILECISMDKPIINLGNAEIPPKDQIDINVTAKRYGELIENILNANISHK